MSRAVQTTTCISGVSWIVVWDDSADTHTYLRDADIVFSGNEIVYVGKNYAERVDEVIDGSGILVIPGFVNIHCHPEYCLIGKGIVEEIGNPRLYMSGLYGSKFVFEADQEGQRASLEMGVAELLLSGVTTFVDLLVEPYGDWLDRLAATGIRAYAAPMYRSARTITENGHSVTWAWDEGAGRRAFEVAQTLIETAARHPSGRLSGMLAPARVDVCTADIFADTIALAKEKGLPMQTHAAQSVVEFLEMTRRHGMTPIQWLHEIGFLGPNTTIGHGIFVDEHSWLNWFTRDDLNLLAETRTTVAHCPTVFARNGQLLEDLGKYRRAGINIGIGTDTHPHNMLDEMRWAAILARVAARRFDAVDAGAVFHMATVGGATALGRSDIGRIAPGMKADLVLVDLDHPAMLPLYDPIRSLLYSAQDRVIRDVYVDGIKVVENRNTLTIDIESVASQLQRAQSRAVRRAPELDWAGRDASRLSPLSFPVR